MSQPKSPKRHLTGVPGVKMLITATALAATLGGWAALTNVNAQKVVAVNLSPAVASPPPRQLPAFELPPLPTVVPPRNIVIPDLSPASSAPTGQQPPVLREVSAPPVAAAPSSPSVQAPPVQSSAPVVVTRSSK